MKILIAKFLEGPGTFRANPFIEQDIIYDAATRHLITQELLELTSMQQTKQELLELGNSIPHHKVLDYVIHQVGRSTKKYQQERKKLRNNKLEELTS